MDELTTLERKVTELQAATQRWWAGEAEVGRVYFSRPRSKEDDVRWLTLQAARELGTAHRLLDDIGATLNELERSVERHDLEGILRSAYEEVRHYRLLADILELLTGKTIDPAAILPYSGCLKDRKGHPELPAMTEEVEITKKLYEEYGNLTEVALSFFEGAGGAIFYSGSKILDYSGVTYSNGEVEKKIAHAMLVIFQDEMRHGPVYITEAAKKIDAEEDFILAKKILETKARVHLRLRNETFGYPLSERRMREIDEGINIQPLPLNYRDLASNSLSSV
jgi:hypothetical protein